MEQYKKVLIISMNPLSRVENNGKTLDSLLRKYPKAQLAQLYFSAALPNTESCELFYRISDSEMLQAFLHKKASCGEAVNAVEKADRQTHSGGGVNKKGDTARLIREVIWRKRLWETPELVSWLDKFSPDVVFFLAGDVIFCYKICFYVLKRYNAKLVTFITDDYVLPRVTISLSWWIRRSLVKSNMKRCIARSEHFLTISSFMRDKYKELFHKDSFVVANTDLGVSEIDFGTKNQSEEEVFVYAGGLHLNRMDNLIRIAQAFEIINCDDSRSRKLKLEIYSGQSLDDKYKKVISSLPSCTFGGMIVGDELTKRLQSADYLVHVESFRRRDVYRTRLSLSTKIPEYMSYKRPIVAVGPRQVASMKYLADCACCITDRTKICDTIRGYIADTDIQRKYVENAYHKLSQDYNSERLQNLIVSLLCGNGSDKSSISETR